MGEIGSHFAKMLLAKQRSKIAAVALKEKLKKRTLTDLGILLSENVEALNTFPGIDKPVMSLETSSIGFVLRGSGKDARGVFIAVQDRDICLGYLNATVPSIDVLNEDDELDYAGIEVYEMGWSDRGVTFTRENESADKYALVSPDDIVARAFGMVINGTVSPLFENE